MVELKILKAASRVHSKLPTLGFRREDFGLSRDLLGRVPWHKVLEGPRKLVNIQVFTSYKLSIPTKRRSSKNSRRPESIKKELLDKLGQKQEPYRG